MAENEHTEHTPQLNIYQKLAIIRKQVEVIQRNKRGYGYTYVSEDRILAKVTGLMHKYSLSLIPAIVPGSTHIIPYATKKTKATGKGEIYEENVNEIIVGADMVFSWVNNDDPAERIDVPWALVGHQTDGSQSFGSGLSYAMRYFLLKYFNVATPEDDPDKWRGEQRAAEVEEDKAVAEGIVEFQRKADERTKQYVLEHSKLTSEEYDAKTRVEWYLFADEAREMGFIDAIIGEDCPLEEII